MGITESFTGLGEEGAHLVTEETSSLPCAGGHVNVPFLGLRLGSLRSKPSVLPVNAPNCPEGP